MTEGITCYERDEVLCEEQMCLRTGCRTRNDRLTKELFESFEPKGPAMTDDGWRPGAPGFLEGREKMSEREELVRLADEYLANNAAESGADELIRYLVEAIRSPAAAPPVADELAIARTWGTPSYPRACVNCGKVAPADVSRGAYLCKDDHPDQDFYACTIDMTYDEAMDEIRSLGGRIADRIRDIEQLEVKLAAQRSFDSTTDAAAPASAPDVKLVYIKRWRTIVSLPAKYADEIAEALRPFDRCAEWQPIETKPADHFPVLIDGPYGIHTAFQDVTWTWYAQGGIELDYAPTHWRPLPERASVTRPHQQEGDK